MYKSDTHEEIRRKVVRLRAFLTPCQEDASFSATTSKESERIDSSIPRLTLPTKSIDQLPTLVNIRTVHETYFLDGLGIDEQLTWLLPVIPVGKMTLQAQQRSIYGADGGSYTTSIRKFVTGSGIYALSTMAISLVLFVLQPFLTRTLSHTEYGALAILNTYVFLMVGLTQLGLTNAFFRAYTTDYESQHDRLAVVSTMVAILLFVSSAVTITVMMAAPWLATIWLGSSSFSNQLRLAACVVLMQNLSTPGLSWLRAENRALLYSVLVIANFIVNLGGALVLVGIFHMGVTGALLAMGGGYAVVVICTLPVVLIRAGLRLRTDIARNLLSFGVPLISAFVATWILQLSDRYLLSRLVSLSETASYTVAYTLGGVLSVVVISPFSLAWPSAMFTIAKRDDAPQVFGLVFRWFGLVVLFAAFGLSFAAVNVLNLFFPPAYRLAAPLIPIVSVSMVFFAIYSYFTTGIGIRRKTWFAVLFTSVSALVNIGLNLLLIPLYGSLGAAVSTLLAFALLMLMAYVVNQRIYTIPFQIGIFVVALLVGIALYIGADFLRQSQTIYVAWAIEAGATCLYGGFLLWLGKPPLRVLFEKLRVRNREKV